MKVAFLAHPTSTGEANLTRTIDLLSKLVIEGEHGYSKTLWEPSAEISIADLGEIVSIDGSKCAALVHKFPLTATEMMKDVVSSRRLVVEAVESLASAGASLVGLGGTTSIIGNRGIATAKEVSVPITSGNSLTAYAAYQSFLHVLAVLEVPIHEAKVAVVGYPGSIALALAKLLIGQGCEIDLVHSGRSSALKLAEHLEGFTGSITYLDSIESSYDRNDFFLTATSAGNVIDQSKLQSGSIVIDIALPRDMPLVPSARSDILVIDGGYVSAADEVRLGARIAQFSVNRHINACLAETILLGLEDRAEPFSIGRHLEIERILEIGAIAEKHGFSTLPLSSYEEPILDRSIHAIRRSRQKVNRGSIGLLHETPVSTSQDEYRDYSDRLLVNHRRFNFIDTVAETASLQTITGNGRDFLDFDAAKGAVVFGHTNDELWAVFEEFRVKRRASATHNVTIPSDTAALCRDISESLIGPGYVTTITTSSIEALQVAERTVFAAYDGGRVAHVLPLSLRALHDDFSKPPHAFPGLLAPTMEAIANIESDCRALVVEPFVDSSNVASYLDGVEFLSQVRDFCKSRDIAFICDETRTAFRTQRGLACVALKLAPDAICVGESLAGGTVPIGAFISASRMWERASRAYPGSPVAMSQLGGNNLASSIATRTIRMMTDDVYELVEKTSKTLCDELNGIVSEYAFVQGVFGSGLLWQLKFDFSLNGSMRAAVDELTARSPGALRNAIRELPTQVHVAAQNFAVEIESALEQLLFDRVITKLNNDRGVLLDLSRDTPQTLSITPPLTTNPKEINYFIASLRAVLDDISVLSMVSSNP